MVAMEMEIKELSFAADSPPLSVIVATKVAAINFPTPVVSDSSSPPTIVFSDGTKLQGLLELLHYIGRVASLPNFYGQDIDQSNQIDEWLKYSPILFVGYEFENACTYIDSYLEKHTFLVGYSLSIADLAIWSGLTVSDIRLADASKITPAKFSGSKEVVLLHICEQLLPDLEYSEACSILNIMNGPWIEQPAKVVNVGEPLQGWMEQVNS